MPLLLEAAVTALPGVGKTLARRLQVLGIQTVRDVLFHLPFRYDDLRQTKKIADLVVGERVTVKATIELIAAKRSPRKRLLITEAIASDETGRLRIVWFGQPYIAKTLSAGDTVLLAGAVSRDMLGTVFQSPTFEKEQKIPTHTARLLPVYPAGSGLTQKQIRLIVQSALPALHEIKEILPPFVLTRAKVLPMREALYAIHDPKDPNMANQGLRRLKFNELFLLQLRAEDIRRTLLQGKAASIPFPEKEVKSFVEHLPFTLTNDQRVAAWEIFQDLESDKPMNRLLQGDVGSGKTVIAAMALLAATHAKYQGALMAPTDILAKQHAGTLFSLFGSRVRLGLYTRTSCEFMGQEIAEKSTAAKRRAFLEMVRKGEIDVVVGTHALLTERITFQALALAVVDEQHRFGVTQRKLLKEAAGALQREPHFLSMTATPIPRTLALAVYGDLDLSFLKNKPADRKPIITKLVEPRNREQANAFLRKEIQSGRQVFVICPMIEEQNGGDEKKTVLAEYARLSKEIFPDLRVGYVHGKMPVKEKDASMQKFASGEVDILVATSVVEVGVNIPNASVMVIENAERFGLAQLHQFRGRVGRSSHQSYCFLFPGDTSQKANKRLELFASTNDGFRLAEYDLEERGPGEVYGKAQSGLMELTLATLKDTDLVVLARELAKTIDPHEYPILKKELMITRERVHLE